MQQQSYVIRFDLTDLLDKKVIKLTKQQHGLTTQQQRVM